MTGLTTGETSQEDHKVELDAKLVERVREMTVFDKDGQEHPFDELINAEPGEKCLVIFIR